MKLIKSMILLICNILGINKEIIGYVQNNYIVYCKDKDKYYNLLPIKSGDSVWYKTQESNYEGCEVLNILKDNKYYVRMEVYGTESLFITKGDKLYPYKPESKVFGYIKGANFIIKDKDTTPNIKKNHIIEKISLNCML